MCIVCPILFNFCDAYTLKRHYTMELPSRPISKIEYDNLQPSFYATISKYFRNSASFPSNSCSSSANCTTTSKTLVASREKFGKITTEPPAIDECSRNATGTEPAPISYLSALPEYHVFMNMSMSVKSVCGPSVSSGERNAMSEVMWLIEDKFTEFIDWRIRVAAVARPRSPSDTRAWAGIGPAWHPMTALPKYRSGVLFSGSLVRTSMGCTKRDGEAVFSGWIWSRARVIDVHRRAEMQSYEVM